MLEIDECEITKSWNPAAPLMVSVQVLVYNHERYIEQCLDSLVCQRTNFPFEIVVHDDASTDNSANIIREYEKKYPSIVCPIYETENQYTKKDSSMTDIITPCLKGKYIAFCEGDDYWCDKTKLQRQVNFLEKNVDYPACAHNTKFMDCSKLECPKEWIRYPKNDMEISLLDVLNRESFHINSLVCRREVYLNMPEWVFLQTNVGDFPTSIFIALNGKIKRFGEVMSVYRWNLPNSWTNRVAKNRTHNVQNIINKIKMLEAANNWANVHNYQVKDLFIQAIDELKYDLLLSKGAFRDAKSGPYVKYWNAESRLQHLKHYLKFFFKI